MAAQSKPATPQPVVEDAPAVPVDPTADEGKNQDQAAPVSENIVVAESYQAPNREEPQEGVKVLGHVDRPAEEPTDEPVAEAENA